MRRIEENGNREIRMIYQKPSGDEWEELRVPFTEGLSLQELAEREIPQPGRLRPVYAIADGIGRDLSYVPAGPCTVKVLDLRSRLARLVYQRTVFFLFLKALHDVLPGTEVSLKYPLNGGLFVKLKSEFHGNDAAAAVWKLEKRMKELVAEDLRINRRVIKRRDIITAADAAAEGTETADSREILRNFAPGQMELVRGSDIQEVFEYSCGGYVAVFFDPLLENTGAADIFELVPYEGNLIIRVPQAECPDGLLAYRDDRKMFEALRDVSRWQSFVNVRTIKDLNRKLDTQEWHEFVLINEAMHEKKIAMIADDIVRKGKRMILIAGPSSSGKTTFAQRLCIQLRVNGLRPLYMGTDDYFVERFQVPRDENGKYNFEDLEAVDVALFNEQMNALLAGELVDMPVFDFITGSKRYGLRITRAEADQPVVVEGIHALNRKLTEQIPEEEKYRIYISPLTTLNMDEKNRIPLTDIRFIRRMARDMRSRNKSARDTIREWPDVRAGEIKNIFPYSGEADVLFNSALLYELAMLRPLVEDSLLDIAPEEPEYVEAQRLLRILRSVKPMTETKDITNNSIMREFLGGGIWVK